ncbi:unnamed protein product [Durusdinium trenchii]|uniref:Uncharacterized protein n=1 Tax=Durusdinium trenchii TaxID=1381693 RepID=A0ABP0RZ85_9DINO
MSGAQRIDRIPLEAPWDRLDFQDQQAIEAYCTDLERIMAMSNDGQAFAEHVAAMDHRFQEAWFAAKFGDANADPMQAFRQPPTAGVVHPQRAAGRNGSGSSISAGLGSEILQRHASLLDGRFVRSAAAPPREAAGAGAFSRNLASAAGPSRYVSSQAPSPRIARQDAFRRCSYCGASAPEAFCGQCGSHAEAADWRQPWPRPPPRI